jgi:hypothetical protein
LAPAFGGGRRLTTVGALSSGLPDQLSQRTLDPGQTLTLNQSLRLVAGNHHRIGPIGQSFVLVRERLAQEALDPVAFNRAADLARHRQSQPRRPVLRAREHVQHKLAARVRSTTAKDAIEVCAA